MRRQSAWIRWLLLLNGALLALLGCAHLVVEWLLLPLLGVVLHAQGVGIFDPTLGGDPMVTPHHHLARTIVAILFVVTGLAHVGAAARYRRWSRVTFTALVLLGGLSFVPTSIVFAVLALIVAPSSTPPPAEQERDRLAS